MAAEKRQLQMGEKSMTKAVQFIKEALGKEGDIIKTVKTTDGGWEVEIEVIERSEYMKKIGITKPVYDKNVYRVVLDKNFNITSYEKKSQKPGSSQE